MTALTNAELAAQIRADKFDRAYRFDWLLMTLTSIADGDTAGQAPADYARTHLEALALGVPTAGGVVKPEPTCYCDADLVAPHPFSECPHRVAGICTDCRHPVNEHADGEWDCQWRDCSCPSPKDARLAESTAGETRDVPTPGAAG